MRLILNVCSKGGSDPDLFTRLGGRLYSLRHSSDMQLELMIHSRTIYVEVNSFTWWSQLYLSKSGYCLECGEERRATLANRQCDSCDSTCHPLAYPFSCSISEFMLKKELSCCACVFTCLAVSPGRRQHWFANRKLKL